MGIEILTTIIIVAASVFILYRSMKKKASGGCDCGSCSSHCPNCKEEYNNKPKKV